VIELVSTGGMPTPGKPVGFKPDIAITPRNRKGSSYNDNDNNDPICLYKLPSALATEGKRIGQAGRQ